MKTNIPIKAGDYIEITEIKHPNAKMNVGEVLKVVSAWHRNIYRGQDIVDTWFFRAKRNSNKHSDVYSGSTYDWKIVDKAKLRVECGKKPARSEIDWEQRRYEIAKEAMNGLLCAPIVEGINPNPSFKDIATCSVRLADAIIKELKEGKQNETSTFHP